MPAREPPDPLDAALRPPIDETPEEKVQRLAQEAEARRVSHEIDEDIKRERTLRKKRQIVKLLLLGQSESGECSFSQNPCSSFSAEPGQPLVFAFSSASAEADATMPPYLLPAIGSWDPCRTWLPAPVNTGTSGGLESAFSLLTVLAPTAVKSLRIYGWHVGLVNQPENELSCESVELNHPLFDNLHGCLVAKLLRLGDCLC